MKINGWGSLLLLERNEKRKEGKGDNSEGGRRPFDFYFFFLRFIIEFELLLSATVQLFFFFFVFFLSFPLGSILLFAFLAFSL